MVVTHIRRRAIHGGLALALILAACSSDGEATPETTIETTTTTIDPSPPSDGQLSIGVLLPATETLIGEPTIAAVETAIEQINVAGGVLGRPVQTVLADEGSSATVASDSIQTLLAQNVDAIVGPASSIIALDTLDEIISTGTVVCSPTASAQALDEYPDNGLFFRTIPSDSLQAKAIVEMVALTGTTRVSIVYADDAYGQAFSQSVADNFVGRPISVRDMVPFRGADDDIADVAADLLDSEPQVVIILADGSDGAQFLEALDQLDTSGLKRVIVNGAMRTPNSTQRIETLNPELRELILGVAPQAEAEDEEQPFDPPGAFATNAFDCVNLIALAATQSNSDAPRDIADQMASVSTGGSLCRTFEACTEALSTGLQINYDGPSDVTELNAQSGDPERAMFDPFVFVELPDGPPKPFPVDA